MDQQNEQVITISALPTAGDIFIYKMYHSFVSAAGVVRILLSVIFLALGLGTIGSVSTLLTILVLALGILNPVITPVMFLVQSIKSAASSIAVIYSFNDKGIDLSDGKKRTHLNWDELALIVVMRRELLIYTNPVQAFVIPRKQLGVDQAPLLALIKEQANPDRCVFRKVF